MLDENDLWVGIVRQAVVDTLAGDEDAKRWIIEIGSPICSKLGLESVSYYLLRIAKDKALPFIEPPPIKKTRLTKWQAHLTDVQNLMESVPGISQTEMAHRLGIPKGRIINCVRFLRQNKQISNLEY